MKFILFVCNSLPGSLHSRKQVKYKKIAQVISPTSSYTILQSITTCQDPDVTFCRYQVCVCPQMRSP